MRFVWVFLLLILSGCQRAMPLAVIPEFEVPEDLKGKTNLRPVGFDSAFIDLKRGTDYVAYPYWRWSFDNVHLSWADTCNASLKNRFSASVSQWATGSKDFGDWESETADFVERPLIEAGYDIAGAKHSSFHQAWEKKRAEILLSAHIVEIQSNICHVLNFLYFRETNLSAGNATIQVEWEIFDKLQDRVIARLTTQGLGVVEKPTENGNTFVLLRALEDATRQLAHQKTFQEIVGAKVDIRSLVKKEKNQKPLTIKAPFAKNLKPIYESSFLLKRAVVAIDEKKGTGFFISPDGYILTALKNVGNAKKVALTDNQGTRLTATVLRKNTRLGVAFLKVDLSNHAALSVAPEALLKELTEVFTIGNPSDFYARNTLGRGIISSSRFKSQKDQRFIQATLPTTGGYAGAPLLDNYGRVLGVQDGRNLDETNFSFYVPIHDILRALRIEFKNS